MNIALISHDNKKELMLDFCIAYKGILENHNLFATWSTGSFIIEGAGLDVYRYSSGALGGEQLMARIALNEIDMVISLRDPSALSEYEHDWNSVLRHCDMQNIPVATNIATAELLIKGLERGDLSWRELVNPSI